MKSDACVMVAPTLMAKLLQAQIRFFFIQIAAMPKDRKATYIGIVCANCPEKEEQ
jgi:uncharacterized protein (DUF111 family)